MNDLIAKLNSVKDTATLYWHRPPKGRYMPFKEITAYSAGGLGVYSIITVVGAMILSTGNTLIGNTIGVDPRIMYILFVLSTISSFPLTALRANIIDNTRSKQGKYRPFIMRMGIPCVILAIAFVWMPYEKMTPMVKYAVILLFNIGFQFFFNFFRDSYENLIYVLSPNSQERTDAVAIKSVIYSLAPSIINPLMPVFAGMLTDGNLNDIRLYRYVYPPIAVVGMVFSYIVYANTREKIVQAKTHIIQIKFTDAIRAVARNKYFWIIALAGWVGFLEGAQGQMLFWLYQYGGKCSANQYGLIVLLVGNASLWGMVAAPLAIRKYGKQKVLIVTNLFNIMFIGLLYPFIDNIWLVMVFFYLNGIVGSFAHILGPSVQADIRDYQQYVTGERIDGMFSTVGLVGAAVTLVTSSILPAVYSSMGINEQAAAELGYKNMYDVLNEPDIYHKLIRTLILMSTAGAVLNVIPYFFYDLKETRQRGIVNILKIRALFEDYGNNALSDEDLVEAIDLVQDARAYAAGEKQPQLPPEGRYSPRRMARKVRAAELEHEKMLEISDMVIEEMNKFETEHVQNQLALAHEIANAGLGGLARADRSLLERARNMPSSTPLEKEIKRESISLAKRRIKSQKLIAKNYSQGIKEYDTSIFDGLFAQENEVEEDLETAYKMLFEAQNNNDKVKIRQAKLDIKNLKVTRNAVRRAIKVANNEYSLFRRTTKPYQDAVKLIKQEENYRHFDDIAAMFDEAKARKDESDRLQKEKEDREKAEREAEIKRIKQEKKMARQKSKNNKKDKK